MKKHCTCDKPFLTCINAIAAPHGDKWYCSLPTKNKAMPKEVILSEAAQRFLTPSVKSYHIPELRATIFSTSDQEFQEKKARLLNREETRCKTKF